MSMTVTGADVVAQLRAKLTSIRNNLMAEVANAMADSMDKGKEFAQERIEMSTTRTGEERARRGGHPGRIEDGDYHDDFDHQSYQLDPDRMQGRFGWLDGGVEANAAGGKTYIELQDQGFEGVPAVHALMDASEVIKGEFKEQLTRYVREEMS